MARKDQHDLSVDVQARQSEQLLDIHEAAQLLRVSEVSIRRYTNSGELPCLRVGGRRERRFRRDDLERYLEMHCGQGEATGTRMPASGGADAGGSDPSRGGIVLEGMDIPYGSHICQFYETPRGRTQMAVPFLSQGLADGDVCFLVASEQSRVQIIEALRARRDGIPGDLERGALRIVECASSGSEMLAMLEQAFAAALGSGAQRLRLLGDMSWFFDRGLDAEDLIDFELRYDRLLGHSFPIVSLCLYDAQRFSGVEILQALKCHADTFSHPMHRFMLR